VSAVAAHGVKGIAFDWGGVFTVGTFDGRAIERLAGLLSLPVAAVRGPYLELMELFEVGAFDLPTFQVRLCAALGRDADEAAFRTAFLDAPLERAATYALLPGIPDEYAVGMLSNNVPVLCDRVRDDARTARIERFVFSNEIGVRKPDPTAYMALAEALQLAPHEIVFVDDAPRNVAAAEALGFRALLLDHPVAFAERWRAALPDLAHLVDGRGWSESDA
jgi:putative hydrolase of the HAD superfamily